MIKKRKLSPRELNLLFKNKIDPTQIDLSQKNKPIEYIINKAEFRNNSFFVNKYSLIPRIETEKIIDIALKHLKNRKIKTNKKILFSDIGTGSGCIGISFALELIKQKLNFQAFLSDKSIQALKVAQKNADTFLNKSCNIIFDKYLPKQENKPINNTHINNQLIIFKSNLMDNYSKFKNIKFNYIFANLPYIPTKRINQLNSSVKDFEPISALNGGKDGFKLYKNLFIKVDKFLKKDGLFIIEVDDIHNKAFLKSLLSKSKNPETFFKWKIEIIKDINQKIRFWKCKLID